MLKRRTRFTDADDFDKLSLLSARVLEKHLAGALGVPLYTHREAAGALDAMWKATRRNERLAVPLDAFVIAAQREVFISCGLDIPANRFTFHGCHLVERETAGQFLFFCVFELVLFRHSSNDELELAEAWNPRQLERVEEELLYSASYRPELNRFLTRRQEWIERVILAQPADFSGT